jgi:tetratricopeptide (TPR) repeat protein
MRYLFGDYEGAAEDFRRALKIDPRDVTALCQLAQLLGDQGEVANAIEACD